MAETGLSLTARDRALFERDLSGWLPERLFDAHVHLFDRSTFPAGFAFPPRECYQRFGGESTHELFADAMAALLPGRTLGRLAFGTPHRQADRDAAARYTGATSDNRSTFGMTLVAPSDSPEVLERRLRECRLIGFKPYRSYVTGMDPEAVRVPEMLPAAQMELADALGLAITLHIPKEARLADPDNQRDLLALCRRWPRAQIILAHIGRAYWFSNVVGQLDALADCPNLWLDTAMVNHAEVLQYALEHFPRERILFGSDAPIAWLRGKSVEINDQYAYLMGEPYAIGSAIYDAEHVVQFTFFYYEMLCALRQACDRAGLSRAEVEALFWDNAHGLCRGIARRLHGA